MLVFKYARIFGVVMLSALFASHVAGQCHTHWPSGNAGCASQNELGDGGMGVHRERWEQFKAAYNLDVARNVAWPQPFKCRDRALMYQFFQTGIDAGWEQICTLTSVHFDSETNQLNRAGEAKVQWLMQTSPQHRRAIFVYNDD
ncbi:MAG TPA: hypothetical protein PKD64_00005, partial [Pirellulaceae bacterium]|nr:hypothetical protein [Pirellulaceae bacterium]